MLKSLEIQGKRIRAGRVADLNIMVGLMEALMDSYDELNAEYKNYLVKARSARTALFSQIYTLAAKATYAQLTGVATSLSDLAGDYASLYFEVVQEHDLLSRILPANLIPLLKPEPPFFKLPLDYLNPLGGMV